MNAAAGPTLRDIHLPPPPGWWPPAPGWWLLAGICIVCCIVVFMYWRARHKTRAHRRALLRELDRRIEAAGNDATTLAADLSHFLRCMALRDRPAAAAFSGEAWLAYLDTRSSGDEFRRGIGRVLIDAPYRPSATFDHAALIALVQRWTRAALEAEAAYV
jgi:hypothetical protein